MPMADLAWTTWTLDLPAVTALAGTSALYLRGAARRRAIGTDPSRRRTVLFAAGVAVVLVALTTPVAAISEQVLWMHMVQHLLLMVVAAPLLALAAPVTTVRSGLSPGARHALAVGARASRRVRRAVGNPPPLVLATAVHVAVVWVWHAPALYDAAVETDGLHALEHLAFLATAVWMWAEVVATARRSRRSQAIATLCLGVLIAQGGVLGALLTFSGRSVYTVYTGGGGLSAVEDQEFAGALMWVLPSFVYATVAVRRFMGWLDAAETELRIRESRTDR